MISSISNASEHFGQMTRRENFFMSNDTLVLCLFWRDIIFERVNESSCTAIPFYCSEERLAYVGFANSSAIRAREAVPYFRTSSSTLNFELWFGYTQSFALFTVPSQ